MTPSPIDLSVSLGSLRMANPVMVASGTFGYGPEYAELVDVNRLGAIVVKGIAMQPTTGNPVPRTAEVHGGMLNAIGLPNPGAEGFVKAYMPFLRQTSTKVIVNIWGKTIEDYENVAAFFDGVEGVHALEVNVSCPNIKEGSCLFGTDLDMFRRVVAAVRNKTGLPLIPKLAPDAPGIESFARAAEEEGADAISLINSYPAMGIDIKTRKPRLANITGGLTGPAIKPIAIRLVWLARKAVRIPIVGIGGIASTEDAIEFLVAGANAVAVGTANFTHPPTSLEIVEGLEAYLSEHGHASVQELVGTVEA